MIVKTAARFTAGLMFLFGLYLVYFGHTTPGGGFAAGIIFALTAMLFILAYGRNAIFRRLGKNADELLDRMGSILFVAVGLFTCITGIIFFLAVFGPARLSGAGRMLGCDMSISIEVAVSIFTIFVIFVLFHATSKKAAKK